MKPTRRILIDNNIICESGNRCETHIEYFENDRDTSAILEIADPDMLALELNYQPIGVNGYRLVEEEILPSGEKILHQEYNFAPDIAYSLFLHWKDLDDDVNG